MARIIIGIHGLANKPAESTLTEWWRKSLREGLEKNIGKRIPAHSFEMVYWAAMLYKYRVHRDPAFTFDALYNNEPYYAAKLGSLRKYKDGWLDSVRKIGTHVVGSGIDFLRSKFDVGSAIDALLAAKLKDLNFYWDSKRMIGAPPVVAKKALQKDLRELLVRVAADRGNKIMIIAHSMGSIIAYDVLRDLGRSRKPEEKRVKVSQFVTIGSPLGLFEVKARIERERWDSGVRTPTIVTEKWINFADRNDPVAVDSHLRDDYSANRRGVRVVDDLVINDYKKKRRHNHHKSYGYLRTPELSELVYRFLKS